MKKKNIKKILIIISLIIICLGIVLGLSLSSELEQSIPNEKLYIDSTGFSTLVQIVGISVSKVLGTLIIIYSILIDALIWIIYGIVLIVIKIIKKLSNKKDA